MFIPLLTLFVNPFLIKEFTPIKNEIQKKIDYKLPLEETNILKKINGFYGQIGPNPNYYDNDYHLFDGNGMIHGIFFDNGTITYQNHMVRTDKYNFENFIKNKSPFGLGNIDNKYFLFMLIIFSFLEGLKIIPNFIGTANTALWNNNEKIYALHERDYPYEIDINFNLKKINTVKKIILDKIKYFTAHPKNDKEHIYAISYNTYLPESILLKYNKNLTLTDDIKIKTKYSSMIHDIALSDNYIVFCNTPYEFNLTQTFNNKLPYYFDKNKNNSFTIVSKDFKEIFQIEVNDSFFIFHYDNVYEDEDNIYFYAIIHENFQMDMLTKSKDKNKNIKNYSKYRKFIINKKDKTIKIEQNHIFEKLNVEFPIRKDNNTLLSIFGNDLDIIGFTITDGFKIKEIVLLENRKVYGEPSFINIEGEYFILCYTYDNLYNNYLYLYNINKKIEIKLDIKLNKGFHSIFINNLK